MHLLWRSHPHHINHMCLPGVGDVHQAARAALIYYANQAILWMPNSQPTEAILAKLDHSLYHLFEPVHQRAS